ncbi:hypothetical protein PoB_002744200 [Plakobranchus ocellatus]|uniref:Uncharacterized protein n=1 Tax=Plakobranchus ocellatus TaxID=259542 RepID=A0AAV4A0W7_9GAST|nr:hypothetical protein PoB_002744200 [Plakobranchus ocellatus]
MMPMLKRGGKALLQEGLNTGLDIARNLMAGENIKIAAKKRVRQAVTKPDGGALTDTDIVAPTNLYAEALFSQVDVSLNGNLTTPSQNTYPWRCFLESLLSYGPGALGSQLALSGFSRDTAGELDNMDGEKNEGFAERAKWIKGSKECDMLCRVHADIFHQEKFLINGVSMKLCFVRSKDSFVLLTSDDQAGRTSLSCQKLDNRALFDKTVIGRRHCLINMATPSRVARHCIMSTNDVTQTCCSS